MPVRTGDCCSKYSFYGLSPDRAQKVLQGPSMLSTIRLVISTKSSKLTVSFESPNSQRPCF